MRCVCAPFCFVPLSFLFHLVVTDKYQLCPPCRRLKKFKKAKPRFFQDRDRNRETRIILPIIRRKPRKRATSLPAGKTPVAHTPSPLRPPCDPTLGTSLLLGALFFPPLGYVFILLALPPWDTLLPSFPPIPTLFRLPHRCFGAYI